MTTTDPPPWGRLITECREAQVPPLSMREGARRAKLSPSTWEQIEKGTRKVAPGVAIAIRGTDDKLARMALVAGASPEQLAAVGRPGAAVMLGRLIAAGPDPVSQLAEQVRQSADFTERQKEALIRAIHRDASK